MNLKKTSLFLTLPLLLNGCPWPDFLSATKSQTSLVQSHGPLEQLESESFYNLLRNSKPLLMAQKNPIENLQQISEIKALVQGKTVLINFWASWCPPCQEEMPSLLRLSREKKEELVVITINQDSSAQDAKNFLSLFPRSQQANLLVLADESKAWSQSYRVFKLPETFLYDSSGKLRQKFAGAIDFNAPEFLALLSSGPQSPPKSPPKSQSPSAKKID